MNNWITGEERTTRVVTLKMASNGWAETSVLSGVVTVVDQGLVGRVVNRISTE